MNYKETYVTKRQNEKETQEDDDENIACNQGPSKEYQRLHFISTNVEFSWKFLGKGTNDIIYSLKDHAGFCVKKIDYKEARLETNRPFRDDCNSSGER